MAVTGMMGNAALNEAKNPNLDPFGRRVKPPKENQPYILDLITLKRLYLQTIPLEIEATGESQFATVGTMGRNNPFYHYTGSEDILQFTITWYANEENLQDVVQNCKWLRSLTKNDGEKIGVHPVQFCMGQMFSESKWIVTAAPYKLSTFIRHKGMLPILGSTDLTLKKITEANETHAQFIKIGT